MTHHYTVLHGGTVLTFDGALPSDAGTRALGRPDVADAAGRRATAICFAHDRILAVGGDVEVLSLAGPDSTVVDLRGRAVLPGFVDPHAHPLWEGVVAARPTLVGTPDVRAAMRRLAGFAEGLEPDAWLVAQYDQTGWRDGRQPARDDLDRAVPDRPVLLAHVSGHAVAANSLALALAGIDAAAEDRPGRAEIERDAAGEPTGVVHGTDSWGRFAVALPPLTAREAAAALRLASGRLLRDGVTAVADADLGSVADLGTELSAYATAVVEGTFVPRVAVLPGLFRLAGPGDEPPSPAEVAATIPDGARGRLRVAGAKLFADGALTTRSAWLREPYADDPSTWGRPADPGAELAERIRRAHRAGWTLATHAIGDAAVAAVVAGYAAAQAEMPRPDAGHRVEHAMLPSPGDIAALARLGIAAVVQPEFAAWAGDVYAARLGRERAGRLLPYAELLAAGVRVAFSSDRPVVGGAPLAGIRSALRHAGPSGRRLSDLPGPSVAEALHAWTAGAAAVHGEADDAGRLASGFRADLAILSADPTARPAAAWATGTDGIEVLATIVDGLVAAGTLEAGA